LKSAKGKRGGLDGTVLPKNYEPALEEKKGENPPGENPEKRKRTEEASGIRSPD